MRYRHLIWLLLFVGLGMAPTTAHADALADARQAIKKGDLRTAQINLRNAVRSDPQNAEARFWLAKVDFDLGDVVAAETEARAARDRGFDPRQTTPLIAQSLLAQKKFKELLKELNPDGKDAGLDASILVARGYAQIGLKDAEEAQKSFALAEKTSPTAVEPLLASARLLAVRGDLNGALAKIDAALNAQPKSPDALLSKSELLRAKGDTTAALTLLDQMIAEQPGNLRALLERASALIGSNQPAKAKADLDAVQQATPGSVQAAYLQAVVQFQLKDYKAADAILSKIAAALPGIQRGYFLQAMVKEQLGQLEQAEEAASRYLARAPNDLAAYKTVARIQLSKRRPDLAVDTLAKVAATGQGDAETYDLLGRAYAATARSEEAVKAYQKAESLAPNDIALQTRLASVRMGLGQADLAMGDLEHTLQLAPTQPQVGEALFFAALATGDLNKASNAVEKVRNAQGDTPVVENLEGLLKLARLDYDGAAAKFADIMKKHPDFIPAKINLARIDAVQGRMADAELLLSQLLDSNPASEPALSLLANQMVQTGRMPQAIKLVEKAHTAQPDDARVTASLGDLLIRAGKPAEALDLVNKEKAVASNINLLGLRAAAQLALNQKDQARDTYVQILKLDPMALPARRQLVSLLMQAGDYEHARNAIKEGLAAGPRNYQLYQDYVSVDLKASGVDAAIATANQLQQQDRDFAEARALKGDVYMAANRPQDAVTAYQEAMAAAPSSMLVTRLSTALILPGQTDSATKLLTDWTAQHRDDLAALQVLGDLDIAAQRYDDAVAHLLSLLDKKPRDPIALNNLSWIYQQRGDSRAEFDGQAGIHVDAQRGDSGYAGLDSYNVRQDGDGADSSATGCEPVE